MKIKVIIKKPNQSAKILEIENTLEAKQKIVGGYIEVVPFSQIDNVDLIVNEEGKLKHLNGNFFLPEYQDCVVGTCIVASYNSNGEFTSLTDKQIDKTLAYIKNFELQNGENLYTDFYALFNKSITKMKKLNQEELS